MGGKSSDSTEQTVNNVPWVGVQQPLTNLYSTTQSALSNTLPAYPNQQFPNLSPLQEAGMFGNLDYAQNFYSPATTGYQQQLTKYMDAPLNISNDPAVQAQMAANQNQVNDWLTRTALPQIGSLGTQSGQYGSSRQGIAEGIALGDASKALANANASTLNNAYNTSAGLASTAAGMFPGSLQMGFVPGDLANQYGGVYQNLAAQQIQQDMNNYYYPEQSLWNKLGVAGNIYSGAGTYGTQTSTGPGSTSNPIAGALGGGMIGNALFAGTPWGIGAGAVLGLLGGL